MNLENSLKVACSSRNHAETYAAAGNFGRAFSHYLVALKLNPDWRDDLKETFSMVLCKWGTILEENKRYDDLFKCYEQAVDVFPENEYILNNLGAHLLRCQLTTEAVHYFKKCLSLVPHYLPALWNLENALNMAVERWHFRMLNDEHRNDAFRESIMKKIKRGFNHVLDIGTGTGILSLMALEAKAEKIYACDASDIMIDIAAKVFEANNATDKIELIAKHSKDIVIGKDIPSKVSMVVSEILDSGLLGERVLQTFIHAWEKLLLPPAPDVFNIKDLKNTGIVIPFGAAVYIAGIECDEISKQFYLQENAKNLFNFTKCSIIQRDLGYDTEDLKRIKSGFKYLTEVQQVLYINFNDPQTMKKILKGDKDCDLNLICVEEGRLDCFAVWFDLKLDEDIVLNTGPDSHSSNCWDQAIFPLPRYLYIKKGQEIKNRVSFLNGKITIQSDDIFYIQQNISNLLTNNKVYSPSEEVVRMLNDFKLIEIFTETANKLKERFLNDVKILDCFQFPIFGLNFLLSRKDSANDILNCVVPTKNDKDLVEFIAKEYGIENRVICRLESNLDEVLEETNRFDIVLLNVVETTGELKKTISLRLEDIRKSLKSNAVLIPEEITIFGQFVESPWLERASKVVNDDMTCGYSIGKFINVYQVQHHIDFNLSSAEIKEKSEPFNILTLAVDKTFVKKVPVEKSQFFNALIYWFELKFLNDITVETLNCSTFHQAAILFQKQEITNDNSLNIYYKEGLFHAEIDKN